MALTWPWRRETRETPRATDYTSLRLGEIEAEAGASGGVQGLALGVVEACAATWARAFMSADLRGAGTMVRGAVSPAFLAHTARELARNGESLHWIGPGLRLIPVDQVNVYGSSPDPATWVYDLELTGPTGSTRRVVPASEVLAVRYAVRSRRPWQGVSPLEFAASSGRLAALLEQSLGDEAGGAVGRLLALPHDYSASADGSGGSDTFGRLAASLDGLRGRTSLLETGRIQSMARDAPGSDDWKPRRLGADPPSGLVSLRADVEACIASVFGVSPSLLTSTSDGTMARESWRRLLHGVVAPLGKLLSAELRLKLGSPDLALEWRELSAADTAGRGRAFRQLTGNGTSPGLTVAQAAAVVGIDLGDE